MRMWCEPVSDVAVSVEGLGKRYRIGERVPYGTLRDRLAGVATYPFRRLRGEPGAIGGDGSPRRGEVWALRDLSFTLKHGEILGIIGRNGAGKSTLLKVLSRITRPTEGRAEIHGRIGSLLEVGTGFHPELTGRENIYLSGAILGMKKAEIARRFDEIVAFADLEKFLDTPVKRYSSGMFVRLAFAVAAHLETEILLVDEVLAVGDMAFQKKCMGKVGDLAEGGRTVLLVSHNMAAISGLCSRAVLIELGQLASQGPPSAVIADYLRQVSTPSSEFSLPEDRVPVSSDFRFRSIRILNGAGHVASDVLLSEGFTAELEFDVDSPIRGANVGFILWNARGECVLTTTDVDREPELVNSMRQPGRYVARCHVPAQYLRQGRYRIDLGASIPGIRMLDFCSGVIFVQVVDDSSVEAAIAQGRQGVIAPRLVWEVRRP